MELVFYLTLLLVASFSRGHESNMLRDEAERGENDSNNEDATAFDSFGAPVYVPNNIKSGGLSGKSAYNSPPPVLPAGYATYLGLGNPYSYGPYNRYTALPYNFPYGYGTSLLNNPAYASALVSGLGYGSPYLGRSLYSGLGYEYPGYLGYRYLPEALRGGPAPVPAPVVGIPRAAPSVPAPVPAVASPVPAIPAAEPIVLPYRTPLRVVRGKDGIVRYYAPDGQVYK